MFISVGCLFTAHIKQTDGGTALHEGFIIHGAVRIWRAADCLRCASRGEAPLCFTTDDVTASRRPNLLQLLYKEPQPRISCTHSLKPEAAPAKPCAPHRSSSELAGHTWSRETRRSHRRNKEPACLPTCLLKVAGSALPSTETSSTRRTAREPRPTSSRTSTKTH